MKSINSSFLIFVSICISLCSAAQKDDESTVFVSSRPAVTFDSVAGAHEAKEELKDVIDFLNNYEKYQQFGTKFPKGILLVGEPGNGKTLLAKALAGETECTFYSVSGSQFIEVYVGLGAARIRDLFAQARKTSPSIIFIDEIDAIGSRDSSFDRSGEGVRTLNQLLTEMDGFCNVDSTPVIVIAATNNPNILDKALLRRFDLKIEVPYPDKESRKKIINIHANNKLSSNVDIDKIVEETAGYSGSDLANLINKAALLAVKRHHTKITMQDMLESQAIMLQSFKNNGRKDHVTMFVPNQVKCNFSTVAGMQEAKEEVKDIIDYLKNPKKFKRLGAKVSRGILLNGDPGNGKTLLARAIAGEANCPFFSINASEFVEMYVGVGAARVRELFNTARKHNPSIIFIDEIDAVGVKRDLRGESGNEERNQTLNQLLIEMDGFNSEDSSVIVIAATNRPESLDTALVRAGRFDRKIEVPYPDLKSREQIIALHAQSIAVDPHVNFTKIARGTPGFSGADLANLVNEAAIIASRANKSLVTAEDFEEACDKIMIGMKQKNIIFTEHELKVTAFHESGHALIRLLLPELSDPLHKITIVPRGGTLGVTYALPEREKHSLTKEEMITRIMVCLGGRAAEELVFNVIGTGATSDFEQATAIARSMVCANGMSEVLGLVIYKQRLGDYAYSQKTAELIDQEVKRILSDCYEKTKQLLMNNRNKLDKLANNLLKKETLYADEVYALLEIEPRQGFRLT